MKHFTSQFIKLLKIILISSIIFSIVTNVAIAAVTGKVSVNNTLRYGETIRPDTFDPYTSSELSSLRLTELLFSGLLSINEKQEIIPDLAEKWEISNNNKTYTFSLRKDVY